MQKCHTSHLMIAELGSGENRRGFPQAGGVGTEEVLTERVAVPNPEGARTCERPSASEDLCMRGARAAGGVGTEEVLTA